MKGENHPKPLFSKACKILFSLDLALMRRESWELLQS